MCKMCEIKQELLNSGLPVETVVRILNTVEPIYESLFAMTKLQHRVRKVSNVGITHDEALSVERACGLIEMNPVTGGRAEPEIIRKIKEALGGSFEVIQLQEGEDIEEALQRRFGADDPKLPTKH
jgi:hypothetical protein